MEKNNYFDINRFKSLLIRQVRFGTNGILTGFGAVSGIIIVILTFTIIPGHVNLNNNIFYGNIMPYFYLMGFIFTSNAYSELKTPQRGYLFLTLPSSTLEKLLVPWLITSVGYILASMVAIIAINIILIGISAAFSAGYVPFFNPFDASVMHMFAVYLVTQSIFVLGAIYFRKQNFLRTILALFLISLIIVFYTGITSRIIVFHSFYTMRIDESTIPDNVRDFFLNTFVPVIKILFWGLMAPFFLVVSYFRLKEKEV